MKAKQATATRTEDLLYRKVGKAVMAQVEAGELKHGSRAPSLRTMSRRMKVSLSTVLQAYMELEREGVLESRPRSGFFVKEPVAQLPLPASGGAVTKPNLVQKNSWILQVMDTCSQSDALSLGGAICAPSLLPIKALTRSMQKISREHPEQIYGYAPNEGVPELHRALAQRSLEAGTNFDPKNLIITNGGNEALQIALRCVTRPGDLVAVETPTYFGVHMILESLGLRALEIPACMEEGLRVEDLKKALDRFPVRACLLTPNFNNPVGTLYPDEKKEEIVKLLAQRKIPLIEDDVYGDLYFGDTRPLTCKHFDKTGQVLFCSSFSKTLSPGLRVGWLEPGTYFEEALKHKVATSLSSPGLNQLVVADFLTAGHYDRHLRKLRDVLRTQHGRYRALVAKLFPEGTCVTQPQGGTVLWIELPKDRDGDRIYQAAQKEGILLMPGSVFGAQDRFRHCIRLNYGRPLDHKTEKALSRLAEIVG